MEAYREADDVRGPPTNPRDKKRVNVFEIFGNLFFCVYSLHSPGVKLVAWHSGLTACTPGSAPGPTLGNEYGKTLPLPRACDGARCRLAKGDDRDALIFDAPHTCCGLYGRCCSL